MAHSWAGAGLVIVILGTVLPVRTNYIPLEAAFQGRCRDGNPCEHRCYDIHNEMYECDCNPGYKIQLNGYSCLPYVDQGTSSGASDPSAAASSSSSGDSSSGELVGPSLGIQIEVDIDPPPHQDSDPSDSELERLGLPTHHVHYSFGSLIHQAPKSSPSAAGGASASASQGQELLRPSDIQIVTYSGAPPETAAADASASAPSSLVKVSDSERLELHLDGESLDEATSADKHLHAADSSDEEVEPPRALPDRDGDDAAYRDRLYEIDAFCNLDCGVEGDCFMTRGQDKVVKKRCLCPHGKYGDRCAMDKFITSPQFTGHSYMALPTLTNAYSDLQLSLEFRPVSSNGVLLLTGESPDMTGDYLALLIRDGHVELRLDCGTGPGIVRTRDQVHLHRWNRLTVYRHDWGVWLQLNEGQHEEGRSQGLFSRITFAQPVLLGGTGSFRNTAEFLDTDAGFVGCIRRLEINNKIYNFEPAERQGDVLFGIDIDECPEDSCSSMPCENGGVCVPKEDNIDADPDDGFDQQELLLSFGNHREFPGVCQCPLGFGGTLCEQPLDVKIPMFNGSSHLTYFGLGESFPLWNDVQLVIKPESEDGLVLYNGNNNDGSGDFFGLFLSRGFVEFAFDNGDGVAIVRSEYPLSVGHWYSLRVSRTGRLAFLSVEGQDTQSVMAPGAFDELSLNQNLYLGGVPTFRLISPYIPIRKAFKGCVQKMILNNIPVHLLPSAIAGANVLPCEHVCSPPPGVLGPCGLHGTCRPHLDDYSCECPLGHAGVACENEVSDEAEEGGVAVPSFGGDSFLHFRNEDVAKNVIGTTNLLTFRLRSVSSNGLLFWTGGDHFSAASDYLMLGLKDGYVHFRFNLGNGEGAIVYNLTRVDDGRWHRIRATRTEQTASLRVDNGHIRTGASPGKLRQLNGNGEIFIGGTEDLDELPLSDFRLGFIGCVADFSVGQLYNLNLMHDASDGQNVERCQRVTANLHEQQDTV